MERFGSERVPKRPPNTESSPDRETPPGWFKRTVDSALEKVADFEARELYEKLGIRTFKKYLPTTGDLMCRYVWKKLLGGNVVTGDLDSVEKLLSDVRRAELIHYVFLAGVTMTMYEEYQSGNMTGLAFTTALNVLVNAYPIMLLRYNKIRLKSLAQKISSRDTGLEPWG